jgi:ADP-ribose pyrophosphatase YjhB (NUDIX family)
MDDSVLHPGLASFKRCPSCASTRIAFVHGKAIKCSDCAFEFFFNAAAAVGVILSDRQGRVLLLRRAKEPGKGKLGVPGGFVDHFEDFETAARREVLEETGLVLAGRLDYLCSSFNRYEYAGVVYISSDVYFQARLDSFDSALALDETVSLEPVMPAALDFSELAFESGRVALRKYLELC